jgi:hypothetical protein
MVTNIYVFFTILCLPFGNTPYVPGRNPTVIKTEF